MAEIVWLASYPKSGNTWLRVLLANYLRADDAPVDINRLHGGPVASARVSFDEWAGVEASSLPDHVVDRLRPGVYRCLAKASSETLFMKTHEAWTLTDRGEPMFPADVTAGVVYVMRNPLDVAPSAAHHWGISIDKVVENLCNDEMTLAPSVGGLDDQLRQRVGSWSMHTRSWIDESRLPVLVVRYEDLRADPVHGFREIVRFCGLPIDDERVQRAVRYSDFDEMRRQEEMNGFRERPLQSSAPFFRRGQVGAWREEVPPECARRIVDAHGEAMARYGYFPENRVNSRSKCGRHHQTFT